MTGNEDKAGFLIDFVVAALFSIAMVLAKERTFSPMSMTFSIHEAYCRHSYYYVALRHLKNGNSEFLWALPMCHHMKQSHLSDKQHQHHGDNLSVLLHSASNYSFVSALFSPFLLSIASQM